MPAKVVEPGVRARTILAGAFILASQQQVSTSKLINTQCQAVIQQARRGSALRGYALKRSVGSIGAWAEGWPSTPLLRKGGMHDHMTSLLTSIIHSSTYIFVSRSLITCAVQCKRQRELVQLSGVEGAMI
jgi:hypothetical protein